MKVRKIIVSIVTCLSLALTARAATDTNILDWNFSHAGNPVSPDTEHSILPPGSTALATFLGPADYYFGNAFNDPTHYGSPTGVWDMYGTLNLSLDRTSLAPVDYILQITQFVDNSGFLPGTVSMQNAQHTLLDPLYLGRTVVVPRTGSMFGVWVMDTYEWTSVELFPNDITLSIGPGVGSGELLLDNIRLTVAGNLVVIPEPSCALIGMVGLVALGIRSRFRYSARV